MMIITSNGVSIPFDNDHFAPLQDSNQLLGEPAALRARYREQGYLYFRRILDRERVLELRRQYFSLFQPEFFKPGSAAGAGLFSGRAPVDLPKHGLPGHPAHAFVRSTSFDAFMRQPVLQQLTETALGGAADQLQRWILRHFYAGSQRASRAHRDADYFAADCESVATLWIPIGDCPLLTGALLYLEDSHRLDTDALRALRRVTDRPLDTRPISHDLGWTARQAGRRWLWADYEAGDVTIHSPKIVHASLDTVTEMMRVSIDTRFVRRGAPVDENWRRYWSGDDGN